MLHYSLDEKKTQIFFTLPVERLEGFKGCLHSLFSSSRVGLDWTFHAHSSFLVRFWFKFAVWFRV